MSGTGDASATDSQSKLATSQSTFHEHQQFAEILEGVALLLSILTFHPTNSSCR